MNASAAQPWTDTEQVGDGSLIRYNWTVCDRHDPCPRDINHLIVWHNCSEPVENTDNPIIAENYPDGVMGWRPTGVAAHTLVQEDPLTITASIYWPMCCNVHGFITNGEWVPA